MTFTPRLVALDIDGTLLIPDFEKGFSNETVTTAVREAIDLVVASGVHVVLASGRAPLSMSQVAAGLGLPRPGAADERLHVVASNGSVVFRYPPIEVVHEDTFDARDAVRTVLEHVPDAAVAVEEHGVGYRVNRHFPPGELDGEMILTDIDDLVAERVSRVIIRDPDSTSEDFVNLARTLGLQGTNYFIGWTAWLDLAPEGVSKASGLEWVCRDLGVDRSDVLAIGDGRNDTEMLAWAGRGVAMGQAPDVVKEAADHVTGHVKDDGAAEELRRWFGNDRREGVGVTVPSLPLEPVPTERLRLPLVTPAEAADMLAGRRHPQWHVDYPREDDRDAASMVASAGDPSWGPRHVTRSYDELVVGSIGFFGPPTESDDGVPETEVGYGLVDEAHGHGAATEALRALLEHTDRLGVRIRASVLPENRASIRVLAKCGFTELRGSSEDGELVMARPLPKA